MSGFCAISASAAPASKDRRHGSRHAVRLEARRRGTMSCRSSAVICRPASLPSLTAARSSLRPIMPAAPVIRTRMSFLLRWLRARSQNTKKNAATKRTATAPAAPRDAADGQHDGRQVEGNQPEADENDRCCDRGVGCCVHLEREAAVDRASRCRCRRRIRRWPDRPRSARSRRRRRRGPSAGGRRTFPAPCPCCRSILPSVLDAVLPGGRAEGAGRDRVAADAVADEVGRDRLGQPDHGGLAGAIGVAVGDAPHRRSAGRDVDDRAGLAPSPWRARACRAGRRGSCGASTSR